VLSLLLAVLFAVGTILGFSETEIPLSATALLVSLLGALLWYERLQFSRMILERDRRIEQLVRDRQRQ
jgi:hypothetical protein